MSQELTCSECHLDMATECECFANVILDLSTSIDDLMKVVARNDILKKLDA